MTTRSRNTNLRATATLALAIAALTACPVQPRVTTPPDGTQVAGGVRVVALRVRLPAGAVLPAAGVLLGGKVYKPTPAGELLVNPDALSAAGKEGLLLIVPGMAPQRVLAGQAIELTAAPALGPAQLASRDQPFDQGGVGLRFDAELLPRPTGVTVATYPTVKTPREEDQAQVNDALLGRPACPNPPCPAVQAALGLTVTVDGHLGTGTLPITLDLGQWLRGWNGKAPAPWEGQPAGWTPEERARAAFAAQALAGFAELPEAGKAALRDRFGVVFSGRTMTIAAKLDDAVTQGAVRVEVDGLAALGVALSITVVSSATAEALPVVGRPPVPPAGTPGPTPVGLPSLLPPPLVPPDGNGGFAPAVPILSDHGGSLLCRGGGALFSANVPLISDHGAAIMSNNGGGAIPRALIAGLVANNGGSLTGKVKGPNLGAHFGLLAAFPVKPLPQIRVTLPYLDGAPSVLADANGDYRFDGLPDSGPNLVVVAKDQEVTMLTLAPAPGSGAVVADINPDTTAIAAEGLLRLVKGCSDAQTFYLPGYADAVARVAALPTYDLAAFSRLQAQLYTPPTGVTPGTYTFGQPWADQLGCTFVTARQTVPANSPTWYTVAAGLPAGAHVGFDCDLNTTFNGNNWIDYTGDPAFGGNGRLLVQMPGYNGPFPRGLVLTMAAAGDVQVRYQDYAGTGLGNYANNSGSIATRFDVNACP